MKDFKIKSECFYFKLFNMATDPTIEKATRFSCRACSKTMAKNEEGWTLKLFGPVFVEIPFVVDSKTNTAHRSLFCLCNACHSGALSHVEASLIRNTNPQDNDYLYRCAICHEFGQTKTSEAWYKGLATAFDGVEFSFRLCPTCVPAIVRDDISAFLDHTVVVKQSGTTVHGEFSRKWFDPNLEKVTFGYSD